MFTTIQELLKKTIRAPQEAPLDREQALRTASVRQLWKVTFTDDHIDTHEGHFVMKVADLLSVPHRQFIRTGLPGAVDKRRSRKQLPSQNEK